MFFFFFTVFWGTLFWSRSWRILQVSLEDFKSTITSSTNLKDSIDVHFPSLEHPGNLKQKKETVTVSLLFIVIHCYSLLSSWTENLQLESGEQWIEKIECNMMFIDFLISVILFFESLCLYLWPRAICFVLRPGAKEASQVADAFLIFKSKESQRQVSHAFLILKDFRFVRFCCSSWW